MKFLFFLFFILLLLITGCDKNESPTDPIDSTDDGNPATKTVILDAKDDCKVLLDNVTTIVTDLIPGQTYTVSVSSTGISGTPMRGAFFMYQTSDQGVIYRYVDDGGSFTFKPTDALRKIAPFLVDWSTISDNRGTVTVNISGPTNKTVTLDAKNDCKVLLDNVTTIVTDLTPEKTYTVSVSSSGISGTPMKGAFFMYQTSDQGVIYRYVDDGGSFTFKPVNALRKIAPFLVDWSTINDNRGTVKIEIK